MKKLSKKLCYWMEDFQYGRRLAFGCYYPDDLNADDFELKRQKLAEYIREHMDLSQYKKIQIFARDVFCVDNKWEEVNDSWYTDDIDAPKKIIFKGEYPGKPGYQGIPRKGLVCMAELKSDDPRVIGTAGYFLLLVPKEIEIDTLPKQLFETLKKYKYSRLHTSEYEEIFASWVKEIPNSSVIIGFSADFRQVKKIPEYVGTVYVYNLYGELAKHDIPDQYKLE